MTISDTFNRADSTTTINPASDGGSWTVVGGTHGITGDKGYLVTASGGSPWNMFGSNYYGVVRDAGIADSDMTIDNVMLTSSTGNDNGCIVVAYNQATRVGIGVLISGTGCGMFRTDTGATILSFSNSRLTSWQGSVGSSTTLRVTYNSSTRLVTVFQNGTSKVTATAPAASYGTSVGNGNLGTGAVAWDNFSAVSSSPVTSKGGVILGRRAVPIMRAAVI